MVISENYCNIKVLKNQKFTNDNRHDHRGQSYWNFLYCRWLLQSFDAQMEKYTIKSNLKRKYHRESTMSKAEIMVVIILFHSSGFRCLKHFYKEYVCVHLRHLFPKVVSYNRFVELQKTVAIPLAIFIKKVLLGKCTGISFVDSTPLRVCRNQRILIHKTFKGIAQRGKCSMGWLFGFKLHLICNEKRRIDN